MGNNPNVNLILQRMDNKLIMLCSNDLIQESPSNLETDCPEITFNPEKIKKNC